MAKNIEIGHPAVKPPAPMLTCERCGDKVGMANTKMQLTIGGVPTVTYSIICRRCAAAVVDLCAHDYKPDAPKKGKK